MYLKLSSSLNCLAVVLFMLTARTTLTALIISIALFGLLLGLSLPVQTTLLVQHFTKNRATAIGVYNFFRYIGMATGPLLGSLLYAQGHIDTAFGAAVILFALVVIYAYIQINAKPADTAAAP